MLGGLQQFSHIGAGCPLLTPHNTDQRLTRHTQLDIGQELVHRAHSLHSRTQIRESKPNVQVPGLQQGMEPVIAMASTDQGAPMENNGQGSDHTQAAAAEYADVNKSAAGALPGWPCALLHLAN